MITYKHSKIISTSLAMDVLIRAGILHPGWNEERLGRAIDGSSVVITAWDGEKLVGIARSISDFAWCGYLSQLAVLPEYQGQGIGKKLIDLTMEKLGDEVSLLVHSKEAPEFYKKIGFEEYLDCYRFKRKF